MSSEGTPTSDDNITGETGSGSTAREPESSASESGATKSGASSSRESDSSTFGSGEFDPDVFPNATKSASADFSTSSAADAFVREPASFFRRFGACCIDSLVIGAGTAAIHYGAWFVLLWILSSVSTPSILKGIDLAPILSQALVGIAVIGFIYGVLDCFLVLLSLVLIIWQIMLIPQVTAAAVVDPKALMVLYWGNMAVLALCMAWNWYYHAFLERQFDATFGKMALGVRVVSNDQNRLSLGQVTLRHFAKMLDGAAALLTIGIYLFFCGKRQIHDWLSNTTVSRG